MRVAIVHDWLVGMRGGERCLEEICALYPQADVFTLFYDPQKISPQIRQRVKAVSIANHLPAVTRYYRHLLPLYPALMWDLSKKLHREHRRKSYDFVLSVSHCAAKNISVPNAVPHISYCLTPMRYIWDHYESYFAGRRGEWLVRLVAKWLRRWDVRGSDSVGAFIAISDYVRARIRRVYQRDADVVYPPVRADWIMTDDQRHSRPAFLCVSALVPYKNVALVAEAFSEMRLPLTIVGDGPERDRVRAASGESVEILTRVSDIELGRLYRESRALVFAAEEDFGMVPVEMQAAGRPVICYGAGGCLETVVARGNRRTGIYFDKLTKESIKQAVHQFLSAPEAFSATNCQENAANFSAQVFDSRFCSIIEKILSQSSASSKLSKLSDQEYQPRTQSKQYA